MRLHFAFEPAEEHLRLLGDEVVSKTHITTGGEAPLETEILVSGRISSDEADRLHKLQVAIIPFAGLIPMTREALLRHPDIKVYNLHHNAAATAEKALELLFAVAKRTVPHHLSMKEGLWSPRFEKSDAVQLQGRKVLVLGYGEIGRRVSQACLGMAMHVTAIRRSGPTGELFGVTVAKQEDFKATSSGAQVLICCAPLTDETKGMVDREVLASLGQDAIVVNVGRGPILDEAALYESLKAGQLHGAGLDVWWNYPDSDEPCEPSNFAFHKLDNVVMSPHIGGTVKDTEPARMAALGTLLRQLLEGEVTQRPVDLYAGY